MPQLSSLTSYVFMKPVKARCCGVPAMFGGIAKVSSNVWVRKWQVNCRWPHSLCQTWFGLLHKILACVSCVVSVHSPMKGLASWPQMSTLHVESGLVTATSGALEIFR